MASQETPESFTGIVSLGEDAADGAQAHGAALGLKQNTEAAIRTNLDALLAADDNASTKRTAKAAAVNANRTADSNGKAFIGRFIQFQKPRIGPDWGPLWEEAGFSGGSISIPRTMDERFILLGTLKTFFHNHAELEVTDPNRPELDVTEAAAETFYNAASSTRAALNEATAQSSAAAATRAEALVQMRRRLTALREELSLLLPGDSPVWYAFGFSRPDDPATPGVPDTLVLTAGAAGSGTLIIDWAPARRATGYRVKIQVAGEPEPRTYPLVSEDQTTITGLPLGVLLTVTVAAHNQAGDSAESAPATITLA